MTPSPRDRLAALHRAALEAVDPARVLRKAIQTDGDALEIGGRPIAPGAKLVVFAVGKAAAAMASQLESIAGPRIASGLVVVPEGHNAAVRRCAMRQTAHPLPDARCEQAGRDAISLVSNADPDHVLVAMVSGGASSLLSCPADGISLEDLARTTSLLLDGGAPIDELNAVRKHLSRVAGGRLAQIAAARRIELLLISDVPGDRLEVIGSGPFVGDPTSYADALDALARRCDPRRVPHRVVARLEAGARGEIGETAGPGAAVYERVNATMLATSGTALRAASAQAQRDGAVPVVLSGALSGIARRAGRRFAALAGAVHRRHPVCLISGGETTVEVRGSGRGGRNQELALAAAIEFDGAQNLSLLAVGSDGVDGPTDAAGAYVDGGTVSRGRRLGLDAREALDDNDSYTYFSREGGIVRTGPSGTNVMDLLFVSVAPDGRAP